MSDALQTAVERQSRLRNGESVLAVYPGPEPKPLYSRETGEQLSSLVSPITIERCLRDKELLVNAYLDEHDPSVLDETAFRRLTRCGGSLRLGGDIWLNWNADLNCVRLVTADTILELRHITTVGDLRVWYLKTTGKELPGLGSEV